MLNQKRITLWSRKLFPAFLVLEILVISVIITKIQLDSLKAVESIY